MSRAGECILTLQDAEAFVCPLDAVMAAVGKVMQVTRRDLVSPRRFKHLAEARHIFYWFARYYTARSYPEIGRFIKRDHCTVMHGVRKIDANKLSLMPKLRRVADALGLDLYERQAA